MDQEDEQRDHGRSTAPQSLAEIVLQTVNSIVIVGNGNGEILYVSPAVTSILGYEPHELLGSKYWEIPSPNSQDRGEHKREIGAVARGEKPPPASPYPVKMLTKSGEERWILWRDARANPDLIVGVGQDITELRLVQEELKARGQEFRALFEQANDGILILDSGYRYIDANYAACEMFGMRREEILGRTLGTIVFDQERADVIRRGAQITGEACEEVDYQPPYGSRRTLECRFTANFRPGFHLSIVRDVTSRKGLQQQIAASQRLHAIGVLAGGVAQEFNNLFTAINGYAELILKNPSAEASVRRYAQSILGAVTRGAETTQQLLAFSRQQVVQPKQLNVNQSIREKSQLLQQLLGSEIQLLLRLREECGRVHIDPGQLTQILVNLALNARDAMNRGGKLIVETCPAQLDEVYVAHHIQVKPGAYVMLAVSDTGVGIEPELQQHIFEPFFTTYEGSKATGLALATVYGIVRQNDGHIWVYSEPGAGTTFKVYLPAVNQESAAPTLKVRPDRAKILVIEDEPVTRATIANVLSEQGYEVHQAADGGEALSMCENLEGELKLVITDLGAPAMSGEDLRAYFASRYPRAQLLHMSGYSEEKLKVTSELPPDVNFLQKPFTMAELIEKVSRCLESGGSR